MGKWEKKDKKRMREIRGSQDKEKGREGNRVREIKRKVEQERESEIEEKRTQRERNEEYREREGVKAGEYTGNNGEKEKWKKRCRERREERETLKGGGIKKWSVSGEMK